MSFSKPTVFGTPASTALPQDPGQTSAISLTSYISIMIHGLYVLYRVNNETIVISTILNLFPHFRVLTYHFMELCVLFHELLIQCSVFISFVFCTSLVLEQWFLSRSPPTELKQQIYRKDPQVCIAFTIFNSFKKEDTIPPSSNYTLPDTRTPQLPKERQRSWGITVPFLF